MATIEKLKNLINSIISKCNEVTGKSHTNVESCTNYLLSVYCKDIIERENITEIVVPTGLKVLGAYSFYNFVNLSKVIIPKGNLRDIMGYCFMNSVQLREVEINNNLNHIMSSAFEGCTALVKINIPQMIYKDGELNIGLSAFKKCNNLEEVTLESGFNPYCATFAHLDLSASEKYSHDTILSWFNALADKTGKNPGYLSIGAVNLAKMTDDEILIATNKNWTIL